MWCVGARAVVDCLILGLRVCLLAELPVSISLIRVGAETKRQDALDVKVQWVSVSTRPDYPQGNDSIRNKATSVPVKLLMSPTLHQVTSARTGV